MHASSYSSNWMQRRGWYAVDMYPRAQFVDRGTVDRGTVNVRAVAFVAPLRKSTTACQSAREKPQTVSAEGHINSQSLTQRNREQFAHSQ